MPIPAVKARQNFSAKNERSGRKSRKKDKLRKEKPKKSAFTDNNKDAYLSVIRCQIYEVEADGNCLFRSICDQLYGNQNRHQELREHIVSFMQDRKDEFAPFVEDFETFEDRMRKDGIWGGNQELYATAQSFQVDILIHQGSQHRPMLIECDQARPKRVLHLFYDDGEHYDSLRAINDNNELPQWIELDMDGFRTQDFEERWNNRVQQAKQSICFSKKEEDTLSLSMQKVLRLSDLTVKSVDTGMEALWNEQIQHIANWLKEQNSIKSQYRDQMFRRVNNECRCLTQEYAMKNVDNPGPTDEDPSVENVLSFLEGVNEEDMHSLLLSDDLSIPQNDSFPECFMFENSVVHMEEGCQGDINSSAVQVQSGISFLEENNSKEQENAGRLMEFSAGNGNEMDETDEKEKMSEPEDAKAVMSCLHRSKSKDKNESEKDSIALDKESGNGSDETADLEGEQNSLALDEETASNGTESISDSGTVDFEADCVAVSEETDKVHGIVEEKRTGTIANNEIPCHVQSDARVKETPGPRIVQSLKENRIRVHDAFEKQLLPLSKATNLRKESKNTKSTPNDSTVQPNTANHTKDSVQPPKSVLNKSLSQRSQLSGCSDPPSIPNAVKPRRYGSPLITSSYSRAISEKQSTLSRLKTREYSLRSRAKNIPTQSLIKLGSNSSDRFLAADQDLYPKTAEESEIFEPKDARSVQLSIYQALHLKEKESDRVERTDGHYKRPIMFLKSQKPKRKSPTVSLHDDQNWSIPKKAKPTSTEKSKNIRNSEKKRFTSSGSSPYCHYSRSSKEIHKWRSEHKYSRKRESDHSRSSKSRSSDRRRERSRSRSRNYSSQSRSRSQRSDDASNYSAEFSGDESYSSRPRSATESSHDKRNSASSSSQTLRSSSTKSVYPSDLAISCSAQKGEAEPVKKKARVSESNDECLTLRARSAERLADSHAEKSIKNIKVEPFDLSDVSFDRNALKRTLYISSVGPSINEAVLEAEFASFGLELDPETNFPNIDVFICQRSHRPRGDARIRFSSEEGALRAIEDVHAKIIQSSRISVRKMDERTMQILTVQFDCFQGTYTCSDLEHCGKQVSTWKIRCDKCQHIRPSTPSSVNILANSWLCKICLSANAPDAKRCRGCQIHVRL